MVSAEFEKAYATEYNSKPTNDELLKIYALNKLARGQEPAKPGMFDLTGKAKYKAWEDEKAKGTTPEQAEKAYIELVQELSAKYGVKA